MGKRGTSNSLKLQQMNKDAGIDGVCGEPTSTLNRAGPVNLLTGIIASSHSIKLLIIIYMPVSDVLPHYSFASTNVSKFTA
jgi:hypothetical protein